jgi:hypothetical protein
MWYNVLIMAEHEPQIMPQIDYGEERRLAVAESQGAYTSFMAEAAVTGAWPSQQAGDVPPVPEAESPSAGTKRAVRHRGRPERQPSDSDLDEHWRVASWTPLTDAEREATQNNPDRLALREALRQGAYKSLMDRTADDPHAQAFLRRKFLDEHPGFVPSESGDDGAAA